MLEDSISAYKDDAGRCSEACPAHVALQAACICRGKVAQRNQVGLFYFTALHHSSQPSENNPLSSPTSLQEQNRN